MTAALCAVLGGASANDATAPKPLAFRAEARIEVDADGKLVKVGVAKEVPDGVRRYVAQELAKWKFVQRPRSGEAGIASTWLLLSACAVPDASGGYSMGLAFHGNGPRITGGEPWALTQAMGAVVEKYKMTGEMTIHFVVGADGTAKLESIDGLDDSRGGKLLRTETERMVEINHFEPEEIDGHPVATRGTLQLQFGPGTGHRTFRFNWHTSYVQSRQCETAAAAGEKSNAGLPVAMVDSVLEVDPVF
jgi:hypothetical protein